MIFSQLYFMGIAGLWPSLLGSIMSNSEEFHWSIIIIFCSRVTSLGKDKVMMCEQISKFQLGPSISYTNSLKQTPPK